MREQVIVITPNNRLFAWKIDLEDGLMLRGLQEIVGGWIETVPIPALANGLLMVVNEEGFLEAKPYNPVASHIARRSILGTVALTDTGWRDGEPDLEGLSDALCLRLTRRLLRLYPVLTEVTPL